ncbi:MAG: hypothetical protein PWP65_653 [Clostridia bacterium]|nr:hypothetical protein [Clostridia bacterium]
MAFMKYKALQLSGNCRFFIFDFVIKQTIKMTDRRQLFFKTIFIIYSEKYHKKFIMRRRGMKEFLIIFATTKLFLKYQEDIFTKERRP